MKFFAFSIFSFIALSLSAQEVLLPLLSNPAIKYRTQLKAPNLAASRYDVTGTLLVESNTLSLPFLDDFSSNKTRKFDFPENYIFDSILNATGPCMNANLVTTIQARFHKLQSWDYTYNITLQQIDSTAKAPVVFNYFSSTGPLCLNAPPSNFQFFPEYYTYTFNPQTGAKIDSQLVVNDTLNPDTLIDYAPKIYKAKLADEWLWMDNYAFVNNTYPIFPPTIGVATLDGLNENGRPYDPFISNNAYGRADRLTSKPINLTGLSEADSLYLSFFYQPMGLGDYPNAIDSLILEFRNEYTGVWEVVWRRRGFAAAPRDTALDFKQVMIPFPATVVPLTNYFYNGFQFRFRNKGSINGNNDHWHIDYVKLDKNRSLNDTIINDIAFINPISTILNNYYTMPADQYNGVDDLSDTLNLYVRNLNYYNNNAPATNFQGNANETFPATSVIFNAPLQTFNAGYSNTISINPKTDFTLPASLGNTDSVSVFIKEWISPNDILPSNDTVSATQVFYNELAYDDGSAEKAYGIIGDVNKVKKVGYEFLLNKPDTLSGFKVMFTNIDANVNNLVFQFSVWDSIQLNQYVPDVPLWTSANMTPKYIDSVDGFAVFRMDTQLLLSGKFYFGWTQTDDRNIQIGYDRNSTRGCEHIYYYTEQTWKKSSICSTLPGSIMIHLLFGDTNKIKPTSIVDLRKEILDVKLYPNPTFDRINFELQDEPTNYTVAVYDLMGRKRQSQTLLSNSVSLNEIENGMCFVAITHLPSQKSVVKKVMKL